MLQASLGRTGLRVCKDGFGALPIQRVSPAEAGALLNAALDAGVDFIDTARAYSDSEEKIGLAMAHRRNSFVLATKTASTTVEGFWADLEASLRLLKTDVIDIYQFHNPAVCPLPGDGSGLYEAMLKARQQGKIRFIGLTNHRLAVARQAVESGAYDTLQFPLNYLSDEQDIAIAQLCAEKNMGFIAMKALSGGLITDVAASRAWLARFGHVVPIWGIQRPAELQALVAAMNGPAELTGAHLARIETDCAELSGSFCRGCGYCLPCPVDIEINSCARVSLWIRRAPTEDFLTEEWRAKMARVENCLHCGQCSAKCPYGLDTPALLQQNYADYQSFLG